MTARRQAPVPGPVKNRYLAAWKNSAAAALALRVNAVLRELPSDACRPTAYDSMEPPERLHNCRYIGDCLAAGNAARWPQVSCAECKLYKQHREQNAAWLKDVLGDAAASRRG